jgi:hypothetical protein
MMIIRAKIERKFQRIRRFLAILIAPVGDFFLQSGTNGFILHGFNNLTTE